MWAWSAGTDGNKHTVHLKYFTMFQSVIVPTCQEGWHLLSFGSVSFPLTWCARTNLS